MTTLDHFHAMRAPAPYVPVHRFEGAAIDDFHAHLLNAPLEEGSVKIAMPIKGSLRREDAAKLYELAHFAEGDVLDIGTNRGLSASILSTALGDTGRKVLSVDMDPKLSGIAAKSLAQHDHTNVECNVSEAGAWLEGLRSEGRKFGFAFVDHSHQYEPVRAVSSLLRDVLLPGSYVAFHDFIDHRNGKADFPDYDVARGAIDGMGSDFLPAGCSGCMGVFRLA